jgi:hypothetical protein
MLIANQFLVWLAQCYAITNEPSGSRYLLLVYDIYLPAWMNFPQGIFINNEGILIIFCLLIFFFSSIYPSDQFFPRNIDQTSGYIDQFIFFFFYSDFCLVFLFIQFIQVIQHLQWRCRGATWRKLWRPGVFGLHPTLTTHIRIGHNLINFDKRMNCLKEANMLNIRNNQSLKKQELRIKE